MSGADILVLAILAVCVGLAVWRIAVRKKRSGCSGNCAGCQADCDKKSP